MGASPTKCANLHWNLPFQYLYHIIYNKKKIKEKHNVATKHLTEGNSPFCNKHPMKGQQGQCHQDPFLILLSFLFVFSAEMYSFIFKFCIINNKEMFVHNNVELCSQSLYCCSNKHENQPLLLLILSLPSPRQWSESYQCTWTNGDITAIGPV